jgi:hypothetical protein
MKWVITASMVLMMLCGSVLGATLNLKATWTPPTTNTDGTPITDTLTYNLYETDSGTNVLINSSPITTPGTSSSPYLFTVTVTASKTLIFAVMAVDTVDGNDSALSATASYVYTAPNETPNAPASLVVTMQPASSSSSTSATKGTTK